MHIKLIFAILVISIAGVACNSKKTAIAKEKISTQDNSRTSLDWDGTYLGMIPCADCTGIKTQLSLQNDLSYVLRMQYTDKSDSVFTENGKFEWNKDGGTIILNNKNKQRYKVGENILFQLDQQGNMITGDLAEKYTLTKELPRLTGKHWKLQKLNGETLPKTDREAFIQFDEDKSVGGNSSCNTFRGSYEINEDKISFSPFAMTRMACIGNDTEQEFMNAIEQTNTFSVSANELIFFDESGKQLAIFEADFFKTDL